jgi:6-pyruvoyltetrahydropterin/6-carboxytetrahydropterin synthase
MLNLSRSADQAQSHVIDTTSKLLQQTAAMTSAVAPEPANPQNSWNPLMFELSKQFRFEAAHTFHRTVDAEPSRRVHGHSYRAEVTVRGERDPVSGMVIDCGLFERAIEAARFGLDHHFLDDVPDLGAGTIENLSA